MIDAQTSTYHNNVIVMSEAGKPIFARHGSDQDIARQCGLIQAIRTAVQGNDRANNDLQLGEIQSLYANHLCIVFCTVGSITLVSFSKTTPTSGQTETEAFARLQLEYVYAQLIFTLTDSVQTIFQHNPGYDLRSNALTSGDTLLHSLLDESGPDGHLTGPFLVGGVPSAFPVASKWRKKASQVLQSVGSKTDNLAFGVLLVGGKLLSVVQPTYRPHQLRNSDLHLLIHFVHHQQQQQLNSSEVELWVPMCLPRFNASGFLYAYINCWDVESHTTLLLIGSHNTTEQFQLLRAAATKMREQLGLPTSSDRILTIKSASNAGSDYTNTNTNTSTITTTSTDASTTDADNLTTASSSLVGDGSGTPSSQKVSDIEWTREESFEVVGEDEYVTVSSTDLGVSDRRNSNSFLAEIRASQQNSTFDSISRLYLQDDESSSSPSSSPSQILHFLFRLDVAVKPSSRQAAASGGGRGRLTQCICPSPIPFPFTTTTSRRRLWTYYQQLSLRLRLGSATPESSHDAFDMITQDNATLDGHFPSITKDCPAMGLSESPPNVHGVTYIVEESEIFLAMNGRDFELYMVATNTIPIKQAAALGTKLVRRLMADEKKLFLSSPLTWKE